MDLTKREGKPVYLVMDLMGTWIAYENIAISTYYSIKKNIIVTKDDLFYLGQISYMGDFYDIAK